MSSRLKMSPAIIVVLTFAATMVVSTLVGVWLASQPSEEELCRKKCKAIGRFTEFAPQYPASQTAGMRGKGPMICKCT